MILCIERMPGHCEVSWHLLYSKLLSLRSGRIIVLNWAYSHLLFQRHSGLFPQKADDRIITGNNMTYEGINIFVDLNHVRNNDLMGFPNKEFIFRYTTSCRITACIHYRHIKPQRIPQDVRLGVYQGIQATEDICRKQSRKVILRVSQNNTTQDNSSCFLSNFSSFAHLYQTLHMHFSRNEFLTE